MKRISIVVIVLLSCSGWLRPDESMGSPAWAVLGTPYGEPGPGDIFREYKWRPDGKWQRVTGPDATAEGAKQHLPNSVNTIRIDDLDSAVKVEAYIEMLLCHGGTVDKRIRVNANPWMPISESPFIPGKAGQGPPNSEYQYMRYPCVRIPMEYVRQGNNTFEFTCSPGTSLGGRWPQWILYGVTFRVYYNSSRPHPADTITKPSCGSTIGDSSVLEARATGPNPIKQVDFIGFYEDFNWQGDGNYCQWQYRYLYNEIKNHIGTATKKPYKVIWDNSWVPTQDRPIKIMARIVDAAGMCYMTSPVENIHLVRDKTVRMYKPYDVPKRWSTRVGNTHKCKVDIDDDLSKAVAAKIIMATWNGVAADEIGINDKKVVTRVGKNHDLSYDEFDVPLNLIKPGMNTLYTHSTTTHHGIEVQWPGMVLMVRYSRPESEIRTANLSDDSQDWNFEEIIIDDNPPQPSRITDVEIVDIDYDGRLDLWFSGRGIKNSEHKFVWYKNVGNTRNWERFTPFPGSSIGAAWGDVDGDGDMDLITGREREKGALVWMENPLNNGRNPETEIWKVHQIHPDPEDPDEVHTTYIDAQSKVAPGLDLNRDGRLDIVIAAFKNTLWYVPGPKDPRKGPWKFYKLAESSHSHGGARIADLDVDGDLDIVWGHDWYENAGEPTAVPWRRHTIDSNWPDECKIAIGDLDKDGFLDVVLTGEESSDGVAWYKNPGRDVTETWEKHLVVSGWEGLHSCQLADFDKDGDLDIFTAQMHGRPGQRVAILENRDIFTNEWKSHILSTVGSHNATVADIDGDGDPDIVGKNYDQDRRPRIWINPNNKKLFLDDWTYIEVDNKRGKWGDWDEPKGLKYFGLSMADVTGDGHKDIISGRYFYRNPAGDMTDKWQRVDLGLNVDGMLFVDVDGDPFADVVAEALPDVYWIEAGDKLGNSWKARKIGTLPKTGHVNGQGYALGQLIAGRKPEILLSSGNGIYYFEIPENPDDGNWPRTHITSQASEEGIGVGDIDGDGHIDIAAAGGGKKKGEGMMVTWWENPGNGRGNWKSHKIGATVNFADRFAVADINGDGRPDVVVSEETRKTDAHLFWFSAGRLAAEQPKSAKSEDWKRHLVVKQFTMNSMDAADMDNDGDADIIINEHRGDKRVQVWENDGKGNFTAHLVGQGKEGHLGARVADMDNDGDLDILSIAWDNYKFLHLWRNDNGKGRKK